MRLTIIFIHEGELMNFQLEYLPSLDAGDEEGIWLLDENKVVTSWRLFNEFRDEKIMNVAEKCFTTCGKYPATKSNSIKSEKKPFSFLMAHQLHYLLIAQDP
jgi:hypothetical protein